ncbi:hypothetical protein [Haloplanus sp. C73]
MHDLHPDLQDAGCRPPGRPEHAALPSPDARPMLSVDEVPR